MRLMQSGLWAETPGQHAAVVDRLDVVVHEAGLALGEQPVGHAAVMDHGDGLARARPRP